MNNKEYRAFDFEMLAQNNEQHGDYIEGRAIVFNSPYDNGYFTEYIEEGALDKTDLKDVRLLVNHDTNALPLARSRNNNANSTMQMVVGPEGMDIRANLDTDDNPQAQALYSAVKRGDVSGMSFMFTVGQDKWEELDSEHPIRRITQINRVYEVSCCTFPAYEEGTSIQARSQAEALESAEATLESVRRKAESDARELRKAEIMAILATIKE